MTDKRRDSVRNRQDNVFTLSALQRTWLTEIGIDRRFLARYVKVQAALLTDIVKPSGLTHPSRPAGLTPIGASIGQERPTVRQPLPADWAELTAHAQACRACDLHTQRDQLVFGAGDTDQPDWLIVGEAPGQAEDRTGRPFQGKAGQLLHAMLVAVGIHPGSVSLGNGSSLVPSWSQPASVYFSNVVKCRPLGNRSPTTTEIAACFPYLEQQIKLLQPRRILALGQLAAQALLRVDADVDALRGRVHHLATLSGKQIPLVVTWHPASLLMQPQKKPQAWEDLMLARRATD